MDKDKVIAAMKKNILSILAGVVALVAIAFMFFWVNPQMSTVKSKVQQRAAQADEMETLLTKDRPGIQTTRGGESLTGFPTVVAISRGKEVMEAVKSQATQVVEEAQALNQRVPLGVPDFQTAAETWPLDGEQKAVERGRFRTAYARWINADNSGFNNSTGSYAAGTLQAELNATRAPTAAELQTLDEQLEAQLKAKVPLNADGNPVDPEAFQKELAQQRVNLATARKLQRARQHLIYIDPNGDSSGFSVHPLATAEQPTSVDTFNAQVGLWVQETVAENLLRANQQALSQLSGGQQNLLNAPVKHIVFISVPDMPFGEAAAEATGGEGDEGDTTAPDPGLRRGGVQPEAEDPAEPETEEPEEEGVELSIDPAADIEQLYSVSPSGRPLHTPFYDLVQFHMTIRVDGASVPYVLEQLQAGSFLNVLNVDLTKVDPAVAARQGYIYGDRPVVELRIQAEMPFLRQWTEPLMPTALKSGLMAVPEETGEEMY